MKGRPGIRRGDQARFWSLVATGSSTERAALDCGFQRWAGSKIVRQAGGVNPRLVVPSGRYLRFDERELIAVWRAEQTSIREIARRLGRSPSTISRELVRNGRTHRKRYLASSAQARADERSRRPKMSKLASTPRLRDYVQEKLLSVQHWSPEQISARLRRDFPDDDAMRVSPETIYRSLFVQGRGELRRELTACLRTGRAVRKPARREDGRRRGNRIPPELLISERPAEADDRAVPGHWEGDLIIGRRGASAVGTLVERQTRYVLLLHLPHGIAGEQVRSAMADTVTKLPQRLWRSLTWDQGKEMTASHPKITIDHGLDIYFCDPAKPWQRGSNENTNGLIRQYLPKGTDLHSHSHSDLETIATALNGRPRKTLNWQTPAEAMNQLLQSTH
jgi:IS30 family transposase